MLFIAELGRVRKAETFLHLPEAGITNKLSKAFSARISKITIQRAWGISKKKDDYNI